MNVEKREEGKNYENSKSPRRRLQGGLPLNHARHQICTLSELSLVDIKFII